MKRREEGITLMVLVIMIIVLLILAGITLGSISDHNGVIEQSSKTAQDAQRESIIEKIEADLYTEKTKTGKEQSKDDLKSIIEGNGYGVINEDNDSFTSENGNYNIKFNDVQGWKRAYKELAYLESTGTQYIDTGVQSRKNLKISITAKINEDLNSNNLSLFGGWSGNSYAQLCTNSSTGGWIVQWATPFADYNIKDNYKHTHVLDLSERKYTIDDITYDITSNISSDSEGTIFICAVNNSGRVIRRTSLTLWKCRIWSNNNIVRDFTPVLDKDDVPCLYDKVEGKYYYNQGTGEFLYGE